MALDPHYPLLDLQTSFVESPYLLNTTLFQGVSFGACSTPYSPPFSYGYSDIDALVQVQYVL